MLRTSEDGQTGAQGDPPGLKLQGSIHEIVTREFGIECLPDDIPEHRTIRHGNFWSALSQQGAAEPHRFHVKKRAVCGRVSRQPASAARQRLHLPSEV
jgi:hypothetical protein